jgi:DNA-binding response OmpR family regulator
VTDAAVTEIRLLAQHLPLNCLLVDDDPLIRFCVETFIQTAGHRVTTAVDGLHAVEILGRNLFDVVISDIRMPRLDGWGVFQHVRLTPSSRTTEVILMTAYATVPDSIAAMKLGACDYLPKPIGESELVQHLAELSRRRSQPLPE